jgi:predicted PhzF superfamily epimerase YddE/YHI9
VNAGRNWLLDLGSAEAVLGLRPDREATMALASSLHGVIVTGSGDARQAAGLAASEGPGGGESAAISSRFFAPESGVFEDPVTGSAHCALAPYWAPILGREAFLAYQASERGGLIRLRLRGDRVLLAGRSAVVAEGLVRPEALLARAARPDS